MTSCPCYVAWRPADRTRLVFSTGARWTLDELRPGLLARWWWRLRRRTVALFRYRYLPPECATGYYAPHGERRGARGPLRSKPWTRTCALCLAPIRRRERWTHEGPLARHRACPTTHPEPSATEGAR